MSASREVLASGSVRPAPFRGPEVVRLLVATRRDWYAAALRTLLEPEGFLLEVTADEAGLLRSAAEWRPSLVLVDYELAGGATGQLCRNLYGDVLRWSVPLVVSSAGALEEARKAEVFEGGAWLVLTEPLFFSSLLAQLRKLAEVGFVAGAAARDPDPGEAGLPALEEAWQAFGVLASLAERRGEALTCVVAGPTVPAAGDTLARQRRVTAEVCARSLRASDAFAWTDPDEGDVVILAYGATPEGARTLVERLNRVASSDADLVEETRVVSAGIREVLPRAPEAGAAAGEPAVRAADRLRGEEMVAARAALRLARSAGGGIRIAGSS